MKQLTRILCYATCVAVLSFACNIPSLAQDGKLLLKITPEQAYIFVDGSAIGEASKHAKLKLGPGDHKVGVVNYGYLRATRTVTITAKKYSELEVSLTPINDTISGPFGAITIEGADRDAVLLNGKTPDFFHGHWD